MVVGAYTDSMLRQNYPDRPALLQLDMSSHPLLTLDRLAALAQTLPPHRIEYNAGELPIGQDPNLTPQNGLSVSETLARIAECRSWMVLKNIETDTAYGQLLEDCLAPIRPLVAARTGPLYKMEGFIFISSPGAVTPFHMDPEHNILMQICGRKTMRVFPARDPKFVSPERHEAFHAPCGHRNLPYKKDFDDSAFVAALDPGDAVYVPVKAPHWVKVGSEVSVSLSVTWRSRASDREARLHRINGWLRARGACPQAPGMAPLRDRMKLLASRVAGRLASF